MQSTTNPKRLRDAESLKKKAAEYNDILRVIAKDLRETGIDINSLSEKQKSLLSEYFTVRNDMASIVNTYQTLENTERHFQSRAKEENGFEVSRAMDKIREEEKRIQEKIAEEKAMAEKKAAEQKKENDDDYNLEGGLSR